MTQVTHHTQTSCSWAQSTFDALKEEGEYVFPKLGESNDPLTEQIMRSLHKIESLQPVKLLKDSQALRERVDRIQNDYLPLKSKGLVSKEMPCIREAVTHLLEKSRSLVEAAYDLAGSVNANTYFDQYIKSGEGFVNFRQKLLKESLKIHFIAFQTISAAASCVLNKEGLEKYKNGLAQSVKKCFFNAERLMEDGKKEWVSLSTLREITDQKESTELKNLTGWLEAQVKESDYLLDAELIYTNSNKQPVNNSKLSFEEVE